MKAVSPRLGINIDHVATLRRLRDTPYPDIVKAAKECIAGGADQITVHCREDRRHITDADVIRLKNKISVPLNLEMAATEKMLQFALKLRPECICLVPEKREERTTEGGLSFKDNKRNAIFEKIATLGQAKDILVSFFIEPDLADIHMSAKLGAMAIELHTGKLCLAIQNKRKNAKVEWNRLMAAIELGNCLGLSVHAGHGIDYDIAKKLSMVRGIKEYNIGHAVVCEALFCGLRMATHKMKKNLTRTLKSCEL